jgi:glycosyltransferase involved in cell wall biosynthesis
VRQRPTTKVTDIVLSLPAALLAAANAYLLMLLGAAAVTRSCPSPPGRDTARRFLVLVPAHDEELIIGETVEALMSLDYPADRYTTVVIADNCSDRTAEVARQAGATVFERTEPDNRGKGRALNWALARAPSKLDYDSVVVVDADCIGSRNLLKIMGAGLDAGHDAVQADYLVGNPDRSWSSALRFAAFSLMNSVRTRGKTALGLSCGLLGTGMAFRRDVLDEQPWDAFSIVEDAEYHSKLVAAGRKVVFAPAARVSSDMPTSLAKSGDQQMRWEGGRGLIIKQFSRPLLAAGVRERNAAKINAGIEWIVPPQSLLVAGQTLLGLLAVLLRARCAARISAFNLAAQLVFVLGGLLLVRAPLAVYRALLFAPLLIVQKLGVYSSLARGKTPQSFVRTPRT